SVDRVRNDPAVVAGAVVEVPEHVAALRVERFDPAVRGTHEEETPRRGQERRVRDDLVPLLPGELPGRGITGRDTAVGTRLAGRTRVFSPGFGHSWFSLFPVSRLHPDVQLSDFMSG